jgi:uncharacterized protein YjbJ (UPF0337 family)
MHQVSPYLLLLFVWVLYAVRRFKSAVAINVPLEYAVCAVSSISRRAGPYPHQSAKEILHMKSFPWIVVGIGFGVLAYIVLNQPGPQYATGDDDVEYAAGRTTLWGSKQRVAGAGGGLAGKIKEGLGRATGDDELAAEGAGDQLVGAIKDTAGKAAQVAGQTIHDLNR